MSDLFWRAVTRIRLLLIGIWQRESVPDQVSPVDASTIKPSARRNTEVPDEYGEFYFRRTILDQLDRYFVILKRMKRGDKEAYDLYKRAGAIVLPDHGAADPIFDSKRYSDSALDGWWRSHRPSFGMVMYGTRQDAKQYDSDQIKYFTPHAVYFWKYKRHKAPSEIQPVAGNYDVYKVTVYWDKLGSKKRKAGSPTEFAVALDKHTNCRVLKVRCDRSVTIRPKHGRDRGEIVSIPQREWGHDRFFVDWAQQHGDFVESYLRSVFIGVANAYAAGSNGVVRVKAYKGAIAATFNVSILRTPYFFRDRDVSVKVGGKRRPIFHLVRAHARTLPDGRIKPVRTHFRGERSFIWNGYRIEISVPGWHHFATNEFDPGMVDEEHVDPSEDVVGAGYLGKRIEQWEREGIGRHQRQGKR